MNQGDIITFENYGKNEFLVKRIGKYRGFKEMLNSEGVENVLPKMTPHGALKALQDIYPADKEALGVYAFELEFVQPKRILYRASNLFNDGRNKGFSKVIAESYILTDWINGDYPDHCKHFYTKYLPGIINNEREIISCYVDKEIVATAILKKDNEERKISTFYVKPSYQRQGIATLLLKECFKWLGTSKPLITIADYKLTQFSSIINKYGWKETQVLDVGYYNNRSREHVFNGKLD